MQTHFQVVEKIYMSKYFLPDLLPDFIGSIKRDVHMKGMVFVDKDSLEKI